MEVNLVQSCHSLIIFSKCWDFIPKLGILGNTFVIAWYLVIFISSALNKWTKYFTYSCCCQRESSGIYFNFNIKRTMNIHCISGGSKWNSLGQQSPKRLWRHVERHPFYVNLFLFVLIQIKTETKNTLNNALHFVNFRILIYQFLVSWDFS